MGGIAGAAGEGRLSEPVWLIGGTASLDVAATSAATVWLVDLNDGATRARAEALALLPGEMAAFAGHRDAGERLLRRRLARLLLAAAGAYHPDEVAIARTPLGAPAVVAPAGWYLSLAARWPACAIGIARAPLGIDVERVDSAAPARDLLTPAERTRIDALPAVDRSRWFARAWAAKEAHAKRFGDPRRADPALIDTDETYARSRDGVTRCWRYELADLVVAVAV